MNTTTFVVHSSDGTKDRTQLSDEENMFSDRKSLSATPFGNDKNIRSYIFVGKDMLFFSKIYWDRF